MGKKYLPVISARLFKPETLVGFQQSFQCFQLLFFLEVVLVEISVTGDSLKVFWRWRKPDEWTPGVKNTTLWRLVSYFSPAFGCVTAERRQLIIAKYFFCWTAAPYMCWAGGGVSIMNQATWGKRGPVKNLLSTLPTENCQPGRQGMLSVLKKSNVGLSSSQSQVWFFHYPWNPSLIKTRQIVATSIQPKQSFPPPKRLLSFSTSFVSGPCMHVGNWQFG